MDWQDVVDTLREDADPKQLIPLYGVVQITRDLHRGNPTLVDEITTFSYWWACAYHSSGTGSAVFLGASLAEYVAAAAAYLPV